MMVLLQSVQQSLVSLLDFPQKWHHKISQRCPSMTPPSRLPLVARRGLATHKLLCLGQSQHLPMCNHWPVSTVPVCIAYIVHAKKKKYSWLGTQTGSWLLKVGRTSMLICFFHKIHNDNMRVTVSFGEEQRFEPGSVALATKPHWPLPNSVGQRTGQYACCLISPSRLHVPKSISLLTKQQSTFV